MTHLPAPILAKEHRSSVVVHLDQIKLEKEEDTYSEDNWKMMEKEGFCSDSEAFNYTLSLDNLRPSLVTVYLNGAEVKRILEEQSLPKQWRSLKCLRLTITGLSEQLQKDTFKVTCPESISVSELQFSKILVNVSSVNVNLLQQTEKEIESVGKEIRETDKKIRELAQLRGELQFLQQRFGELTSQMNLDSFSQFWTFYLQESRSFKNNISNLEELYLEDALMSLQNRKRELEWKLTNLRKPETNLADSVSILLTQSLVQSSEKGEMNQPILELSYLVSGVSWAPKYEVRGHSKENKVLIKYLGEITQNSGEQWQATSLTLSTSTPFFRDQKPSLQKESINQKRGSPRPNQAFAKAVPMAMAMSESLEADGAMYEMAPPMGSRPKDLGFQSRVENSFSSVTYRLSRLVNLQSSSTPVKIPITELDFDGQFSYLALPSVNNQVYSSVKFNNTSNFLLLEGLANMYLENTFIGYVVLQKAEVGKEIEVSFGVDASLVVEKGSQKRNQESFNDGLLFNSHKIYKRTIEDSFSITNRKPVELQISIQYPIPSVEKRKDDKYPQVNLVVPDLNNDQEKKIASFDPEQSRLTWNLTVPAFARTQLFVEYNIIWDPAKDWIAD